MVGQASGTMSFDPMLMVALAATLVGVDVVILIGSIKAFGRDRILTRFS